MPAKYRVAVIILNYRGEMVLPSCLESVFSAIESDDHVLVVDNGQENALMVCLKQQFPRLQVLSLSVNVGFAAGMNAGMRFFTEKKENIDAYWLLNNDTVVAEDTLLELKKVAQNRERTLFSPLIQNFPGDGIWFAGGRIDFWRMKTLHYQQLRKEKSPFPTDFLTGCALFIPHPAFEVLGPLDERYFLYAEDAEYSLRAKRAKIDRFVVPTALVRHAETSEMNPKKAYWLIRSTAEFFLRESAGWQQLWVPAYYLLRRVKNKIRLAISRGKSPLAREIERAYTDVSL